MFEAIQNLDVSMVFAVQSIHNAILDIVMNVISMFGSSGGVFWGLVGIALCITKRYRKIGVLVIVVLGVSAITGSFIIKPLVERVRPCNEFLDVALISDRPHSYSFPSQHTFSSFAAASALCFLSWKIGIPALCFAGLIGFSRVYAFEHYPTDVFFGAVFGIIVTIICSYFVFLIYNKIATKLIERKKQN